MHTETSITLKGFLVGPTWGGGVGYVPFSHDVNAQDRLWGEKGPLRDHCLAATNCGDFQHCRMGDAYLVITRRSYKGETQITRSRSFPLTQFASVADIVDTEWDGPDGDDF